VLAACVAGAERRAMNDSPSALAANAGTDAFAGSWQGLALNSRGVAFFLGLGNGNFGFPRATGRSWSVRFSYESAFSISIGPSAILSTFISGFISPSASTAP
jgi:hypothetical protein